MATRSVQFPPAATVTFQRSNAPAFTHSTKGGVVIDLGAVNLTDGFDGGSGAARSAAYERCVRGETPRWPPGA